MNARPVLESINPQGGVGRCVPTPRKERDASIRMALPSQIAFVVFGRSTETMTRHRAHRHRVLPALLRQPPAANRARRHRAAIRRRGEAGWSIGRIVGHIGGSRLHFASAYRDEVWIWTEPEFDPKGQTRWLSRLQSSAAHFAERLRDTPEAWLTRRIEMIDTSGQTLSGWHLLMMMLEHEVHRRSQIDAYAGLQGWPGHEKTTEDPDPIDLAPGLGGGGAGHREGPEGEAADGGAPVDHSMTWSARRGIDGGTVRPSAVAVRMLSTNSNFVGCSTGRSAVSVLMKILCTSVAAR